MIKESLYATIDPQVLAEFEQTLVKRYGKENLPFKLSSTVEQLLKWYIKKFGN